MGEVVTWKVPLFDVDFGQEEVEAVTKVVKSGWLTMGETVQEFERRFAEFIGVKHAIAVNSCTAALHLANLVLGIGLGDEVICPSLTFVATANSIRYTGAIPVFADVTSLDNWNIGLDSIKAVTTPRTKAIIVVHYAGYPCDMPEICEYAKREGLKVIEDCAHAPGASIWGRMVGGWGDVGCFSFFGNKNLSTGEGGIITTDDDGIAEKLRLLRSHGMTSTTLDRHKGHAFGYDVVTLGYNYRMTEIAAALGLIQLDKLGKGNERRRQIVEHYRERLSSPESIRIPFGDFKGESAYHIFPILLAEGIDRNRVMERLKQAGIQTSIHFSPVHLFSLYRRRFGFKEGMVPRTEEIASREVSLPLHSKMSPEDVKWIAKKIRESV